MWKWVLVPGIIYAILFVIGIGFFIQTASDVIEFLTYRLNLNEFVQKLKSSWIGFLFTMGGITVWMILLLFYFSVFKYLWLIACSPLYALLSQRTEAIIAKESFRIDYNKLKVTLNRAVILALSNFLRQTLYLLIIFFVSLIPIIGWIMPLVAIFFECFFYGYSMLDYSLERLNIISEDSYAITNKNKGLAFGNGMLFYLMHFLPIIGWFLAPAYAIVAATICIHQYNPYPSKEK
jgi:CysZ protein